MKDTEAIKLSKIDRDREFIRELSNVLRNPAIAIVLAFVIVEALQKVYIGPKKEPLMGTIVGTGLEGALIAGPMIEAVGKSTSSIAPVVAATLK